MHMNLGQGERQGEGRQQLGMLQMLPSNITACTELNETVTPQ